MTITIYILLGFTVLIVAAYFKVRNTKEWIAFSFCINNTALMRRLSKGKANYTSVAYGALTDWWIYRSNELALGDKFEQVRDGLKINIEVSEFMLSSHAACGISKNTMLIMLEQIIAKSIEVVQSNLDTTTDSVNAGTERVKMVDDLRRDYGNDKSERMYYTSLWFQLSEQLETKEEVMQYTRELLSVSTAIREEVESKKLTYINLPF